MIAWKIGKTLSRVSVEFPTFPPEGHSLWSRIALRDTHQVVVVEDIPAISVKFTKIQNFSFIRKLSLSLPPSTASKSVLVTNCEVCDLGDVYLSTGLSSVLCSPRIGGRRFDPTADH